MYLKLEPNDPVGKLVENKHLEYVRKAKYYAVLYYFTRVVVGLSAVMLFLIVGNRDFTWAATILSAVVLLTTVIDVIFSPKDQWVLHSKATDLITIAKI
jgi:hypothetical protein